MLYFCAIKHFQQKKIYTHEQNDYYSSGQGYRWYHRKVCTYLAENSINILDISQTIVQEYFNMMMIVDMGKMTKSFEEVADDLAAVGKDMVSRSSASVRKSST